MDGDKDQSIHLLKDDESSDLNINNIWIMESAEQQGLMSPLMTFLKQGLGQEAMAELFQTFISSNSEVWQEVGS